MQITATAVVSYAESGASTYETGAYAAGPAFISGTLDLTAPEYTNAETSQDVVGAVATTAGMQMIAEGAAAS